MVTINIANKEFMKNIGYEIVGTGGGKVLNLSAKSSSGPTFLLLDSMSSFLFFRNSIDTWHKIKVKHFREESANVCQCQPKMFSHLIPSPAELIVVLAFVLEVLQPVLRHFQWI